MPFPDFVPSVPVWIRHLAERFGERELIVGDDERLTYAQAEARSGRLARGLLAAGVAKGARVGLLMPNGPDWVVAWLAAARIGAVAVPLNTFFQARELAWILRHADVDTLLCVARFLGHDYVERLEAAAPGLAGASGPPLRIPSLPFLRRVFVWGDGTRTWARDGAALEAEAGGDAALDEAFLREVERQVVPADPMLILYSSGSTADPKGAVHTHGALIRHSFQLAQLRSLRGEDRVWSPMPFFWVGGFVFAFLANLHKGATTLGQAAFDPERTLEFLERERASLAIGWPHFGKALAEHPSRARRDLSALRGGNLPGILPPDVCPPEPDRRGNALGMTETCGPHTWGGDGVLPESRRGTFGASIEGVEHRVVDPQTREALPPGTAGEICVRGYNVMQGLHKLEREDVFSRDGFYATGDGGFFDAAGLLHFEGRLGDLIKTGGANVTPSEVEQALLAQPEVKEAYVVGVPDPERGQNVAASVVLKPGASVPPDALRERLRKELAAYKVPRHLFVDRMEELPFTDSGKIEKRRLAKLLAERIAGASR
jgi:acyl-CoA synthetase (AMP-forming)/AMP-acid ligase II